MVSSSINSGLADAILAKLNKKITKGVLNSSGEIYYFIDIILPIDKIDSVNSICEIRFGINMESKKMNTYNMYFNVSIGTSKYDQKEDIFYKYIGLKSFKKLVESPLPNRQTDAYRFAVSDWIAIKLRTIQKMITSLRVSPQRDRLIINYEEESLLWEAKKKFCKEIEKLSEIKTNGGSEGTARVEASFKECCVCDEETTNKTTCKHHICIVCLSRLHKQKCPVCRGTMYPENEEDDDSSSDEEDEEDEEEEVLVVPINIAGEEQHEDIVIVDGANNELYQHRNELSAPQ